MSSWSFPLLWRWPQPREQAATRLCRSPRCRNGNVTEALAWLRFEPVPGMLLRAPGSVAGGRKPVRRHPVSSACQAGSPQAARASASRSEPPPRSLLGRSVRARACACVCVCSGMSSGLFYAAFTKVAREAKGRAPRPRPLCCACASQSRAPGVLGLCLCAFQTPFQPCFQLITVSAAGTEPGEARDNELLEAGLERTDILLRCLIDFIFLL